MLAINNLQVGMRFRSIAPVFRGDNIEFPTGVDFEVIRVDTRWIKLRCDVEGRVIHAPPVPRPETEPEDYFHHVTVNINTLNNQFAQI